MLDQLDGCFFVVVVDSWESGKEDREIKQKAKYRHNLNDFLVLRLVVVGFVLLKYILCELYQKAERLNWNENYRILLLFFYSENGDANSEQLTKIKTNLRKLLLTIKWTIFSVNLFKTFGQLVFYLHVLLWRKSTAMWLSIGLYVFNERTAHMQRQQTKFTTIMTLFSFIWHVIHILDEKITAYNKHRNVINLNGCLN